jgi:hypothetical protein
MMSETSNLKEVLVDVEQGEKEALLKDEVAKVNPRESLNEEYHYEKVIKI